jgi:hypothetical protein
MGQKKAQHTKAQQRHLRRRQTLKHYVPRGNPELASQSIALTDNLLHGGKEDEDDGIADDDDDIIDLTGARQQPPLVPPTSPSLLAPPLSASKPTKRTSSVAPEDLCPKCEVKKTNTNCTNYVCKQCCVSMHNRCSEPGHMRSKVGARQGYTSSLSLTMTSATTTATAAATHAAVEKDPADSSNPSIVARIDATMQSRTPIFVSYAGGTRGPGPRKITPLQWLSEKGGKFDVLCHFAQEQAKKQTFWANKVVRIEDHDWDMPAS